MPEREALDLDKLAKICARFGSDFPEERATAAAIADRLVRDAGYTWELIFRSLQEAATRLSELEARTNVPATSSEWDRMWTEPQTHGEAIEACLDYPSAMSEWELNFLVSISGRSRLSAKQLDVLNRLVTKARTAARAAGAL